MFNMITLKKTIKKIGSFILQFVIGKKKLDKIRHKKYLKKESRLIREVGPIALQKFYDIAKEESCEYWLFWGSLLGAYRDKGFIKHDDDIDIGMYDTDISVSFVEKMKNNGFNVIWAIVDKDFIGGYHLACTYQGVKFDIYSFHRDVDSKVNTVFCPLPYKDTIVRENAVKTDVMHINMESWDHLDEISFEGVKTYIPCNADSVLRSLYGNDYMIPIVDKKAQDDTASNKVVEDHDMHYACMMSYEVFKMLKKTGAI